MCVRSYTTIFIFVFLLLNCTFGFAQETKDALNEALLLQLEFRPRTELRNGYRELRSDTSSAALFTSQRARLSLTVTKQAFTFHSSVQDIRVWGENDPRSTTGTLQVFETYIEPKLSDRFSLRIGRQTLIYDNQRLFGQNEWRQNARSHDAIRLRYHAAKKINSDLALAFNQTEERLFGTGFYPIGFTNYKFLAVSYFQYQSDKNFSYNTINAADGFQDTNYPEKMNVRLTHGGRVEYTGDKVYATLSAYYQHGHNPAGTAISAYYLQPEVKVNHGKATARLGAEIFSGNSVSGTVATKDRSFVPLYGLAHRFNGYMDYFIRFPSDVSDAGLINPYLVLLYQPVAQWLIRADNHLFYTQKQTVASATQDRFGKYLGFENDIVASWIPNNYTTLDIGFAWIAATTSMEAINNRGNSDLTPYWGYVMFTFKPELLRLALNNK